MRVFAYRATAAGIQRIASERGQPIAAIEAVREERALVRPPVADNVARLATQKTTAHQVIADIARQHGLTYADLIGRDIQRHICRARDEAMSAVKALSDGGRYSFSQPMLGRLFGGRNHTSVLAALRRHAKRGQT